MEGNLAVAHCLWYVVLHSLQTSQRHFLNLDIDAFFETSTTSTATEADVSPTKRRRLDTVTINLWPNKIQKHIQAPGVLQQIAGHTQSNSSVSCLNGLETHAYSSASNKAGVQTFRELFRRASSVLKDLHTAKQKLIAMHALHVLVFVYAPLRRFGSFWLFDKVICLARRGLRLVGANVPSRCVTFSFRFSLLFLYIYIM